MRIFTFILFSYLFCLNVVLAEDRFHLKDLPSPQFNYAELKEELEKKHADLSVEFVVGKANPQFIRVSPSLWRKELDLEEFSKTEALGRMLCPGHARNPGKKYLVVVRADDPGETLVHEYLHYLQAKRKDSKVCELYQQLEVSATVENLNKNKLLEYEVQRFLLESWPLSIESRAGILEKLAQYQKEIPSHASKCR